MSREQKVIQAALEQARYLCEVHGAPQIINLSVYASDQDLRQLRPEDGPNATVAEQRSITEAVATALRREGHQVKMIELRAAPYLRWLTENNRSNDAGARAEWINCESTKNEH